MVNPGKDGTSARIPGPKTRYALFFLSYWSSSKTKQSGKREVLLLRLVPHDEETQKLMMRLGNYPRLELKYALTL